MILQSRKLDNEVVCRGPYHYIRDQV